MFLLILFSFLLSRGQDFSYTQYDVKDGLAGSVVYCAAEDKEGFLWFGTENGLSRYDGTHFRNFTTSDGLPDNEILKLFVDSRNRIWVIPFRNSICYYQNGELHTQENDTVLRRLSISSEITSISEDKPGNIIMTEASGLHIISPDMRIKTIRELDGLLTMIPIGGGLNGDGMFNFFIQVPTGAFRHYVVDGDLVLFTGTRSFVGSSVNVTRLSPQLDIFQHRDSLYVQAAAEKRFALTLPYDLNALSIIDDSLLIMNTTNGSRMYDLRTRKERAHFLTGQSINSVIRDSEGDLWFLCAGAGVFRIGSLGFRRIRFGQQNNLSVTCIQKVGGSLYIGTERSSLWRTDLSLQRVDRQEINWHANKVGHVQSILPLDSGGLLLGTDGGLFRVTHQQGELLDYFSVKSLISYEEIILVSMMAKVEVLHYPDLQKPDVIWFGRSTCSFRQDSIFYIGTINGLYRLIPGGKFLFLGNISPILKSRISTIAASQDGTLWIGTSGGGIAGLRDGRVVHSFTEKEGLTSNICRTIFAYGHDIWIGTDKGLNRVHLSGGDPIITTYGTGDGLSSDIINVVYVNNNNVYVGSANGLTYFNVQEAAKGSFCKLRVTSVQAAHAMWPHDTSGIVLPRRENAIRVDFAGISYRSAGDITYSYRLKGLSDSWQTTRETFLSYPTLPSGKYELEIIATNKFGVRSNLLSISFRVKRFLWEEPWFILLAGALLAGGAGALVRRRVRQLNRKNAEKLSISNRMAELEQMSLRAQMNPHFIFNSLNSIQKYVMDKDIMGANKFITDFSRLIRLTLDITSRSRISLEEEVRYISYYLELEKARFGNSFRYDIFISPGIDKAAYQIPPMLLQPYVENSIRHGLRSREDDRGLIRIQFIENGPHLVCVVEDNGVGRRQTQLYKSRQPIEYQSRGMTLTARRVEMMNQGRSAPTFVEVKDLETPDHQPAGTSVRLYFPLQYVKV
jgi:ligand-binding sensor domain-containing protein